MPGRMWWLQTGTHEPPLRTLDAEQGAYAMVGATTTKLTWSPPAGGSVYLATNTLQNTSASAATPSESFVVFGQAFAKGDVPSGRVPEVRRKDTGAALPAQFDLRSTWPDGSLRWCEVTCVAPSIAASGTFDVDIYSVPGSYDNDPVRSLSEVTAGHDLNIAITNCVDYYNAPYMGGASTLFLSECGNIELIKSGPVCDQWRVWDYFGSQDNLAGIFYVTAFTSPSSGNLATISHLAKIHNGWLNPTAPSRYYYSCEYKDGASVIRDFNSTSAYDKTFTVTGSNTVTCTGHGLTSTDGVLVSGANLPPELVEGDDLYAVRVDDNTLGFANNYGLGKKALSGAGDIPPKGGTLHHRLLHPCRSYQYLFGVDALPDWTSNEPTIWVKQDKTYLRATGAILPFDLNYSLGDSAGELFEYHPFRNWTTRVGGTTIWPSRPGSSGHPSVGWITPRSANVFFSQDADWARQSRVEAAEYMIPQVNLNEATGKLPPMRGSSLTGDSGSYPVLGPGLLTTYWASKSSNNGITYPSGANPSYGGGYTESGMAGDHSCNPFYYIVLSQGGAHWIEACMLWANSMIMCRSPTGSGWTDYPQNLRRKAKVTGGQSTYSYDQCCFNTLNQPRLEGWLMTAIVEAALVAPDDWDEHTYFMDILNNNARFVSDFFTRHADKTNFINGGSWFFGSGDNGPGEWQQNYLAGAIIWAEFLFETADLATWRNHLAKHIMGWTDGVHWPCPHGACSYGQNPRDGDASAGSVTGMDNYADWPDVGTHLGGCQTDSVTNVVTRTGSNPLMTIQDGMKVKWTIRDGGKNYQELPSGITAQQWYWVINTNGDDHQLSEEEGGAVHSIGTIDGALSETDPFDTVQDSPLVTMFYSRPPNPSKYHYRVVGDTVEFSGVAVFNGLNLNGQQFVVLERTTTTLTFDAGSNATATGSGGGSSCMYHWWQSHGTDSEYYPKAGSCLSTVSPTTDYILTSRAVICMLAAFGFDVGACYANIDAISDHLNGNSKWAMSPDLV